MRNDEPRSENDVGDRRRKWLVRDAPPAVVQPQDPDDEHDGWEAIRPRRTPLPPAIKP